MEELAEKRVWQRVRGEGAQERVRSLLADQGPVLGTYRSNDFPNGINVFGRKIY